MGFVLIVKQESPRTQQWRHAIADALPTGTKCRVFDYRDVIGDYRRLPKLVYDRKTVFDPKRDSLELFLDR